VNLREAHPGKTFTISVFSKASFLLAFIFSPAHARQPCRSRCDDEGPLTLDPGVLGEGARESSDEIYPLTDDIRRPADDRYLFEDDISLVMMNRGKRLLGYFCP
jgi:hypothetical protein